MNESVIVVLEDAHERVDWLRREFPTRRIEWCETVNDLFARLETLDAVPDLILLDHDLGDVGEFTGPTWPRDIHGMCGMDAADQLPERWRSVPIIVWSINTPRAQEMVLRLRDRGFAAEHLAYTGYWPLRRGIVGVLEAMDKLREDGHGQGD